MSTTWIRVTYALLLGVVLAITAGFGVLIFETGPKPPQPAGVSFAQLTGQTSDTENSRIAKQIDSFFSDNQTYREKFPDHQRNIFLWFGIIGLVLGAIGVGLPAIVNYLRLGFLFGGLLLLVGGSWFALQPVPQGAPPASSILALLSVGTPSQIDSAGRFLRFAVGLVGLLVLVFVGLWRLTDWSASPVVVTRVAPPVMPVAQAPAYPAPMPAAAYSEPVGAPYGSASPATGDSTKWAKPDEATVQVATVTSEGNTQPEPPA